MVCLGIESPLYEERKSAIVDGDEVAWVTARGENQLEAFSTAQLRAIPPMRCWLQRPSVGLQPIAVANSNRFNDGMTGSVSIVVTSQALANKPATPKTFGVGVFPREWALSPDRRKLLLTEFGTSVLDIFDVDTLADDQ